MPNEKKVFILDTSVLLHNAGSIRSFSDNTVVVPYVVLEELDKFKTYDGEIGKNARQVIRSLNGLREQGRLSDKGGVEVNPVGGKLRVELNYQQPETEGLNIKINDDRILNVCLGLSRKGHQVALVTKDINLAVRADVFGVEAQDFRSDKLVGTTSDVYAGTADLTVPDSVIEDLYSGEEIPAFALEAEKDLYPNQYLTLRSASDPNKSVLVRNGSGGKALTRVNTRGQTSGISARNREQLFALDALRDPDIPLVTLTGRAGSGKAQPLDADVLTPNGYVKMRSIKVGDFVSTPDGGSAKVLGVFPQGKVDIYRVEFSDGTSTECCLDHLWETQTERDRKEHRRGSVKSLEEIIKTLHSREASAPRSNHSIPMTKPVEFSATKELPMDSYLLGLLIGDGGLNWKIPNPLLEVVKRLELHGSKSENKFVPHIYKHSSVEDRISLLQGLMDTDGTVGKDGTTVTYTTVSQKLSEDIKFIVESLGGKAAIKSRVTEYTHNGEKRTGKLSYRLHISMPAEIIPFRLERKLSRFKPRTKYKPTRYIRAVEKVGKKEAQCILIDSQDHLYLTNNFIVTHNTLVTLACALELTQDKQIFKKLVVSRPVQPMGKDLGYLPGSIEEKMDPWMGPIKDALEFLGIRYDDPLVSHMIDVEPLTYIRGRSLPNTLLIIDECQSLTKHEIKTIVSRMGEGSKLVLIGDINQIDNPYLDATNNGLTHVIEKFKPYELAAHVALEKGERSPLATLAADIL